MERVLIIVKKKQRVSSFHETLLSFEKKWMMVDKCKIPFPKFLQ